MDDTYVDPAVGASTHGNHSRQHGLSDRGPPHHATFSEVLVFIDRRELVNIKEVSVTAVVDVMQPQGEAISIR